MLLFGGIKGYGEGDRTLSEVFKVRFELSTDGSLKTKRHKQLHLVPRDPEVRRKANKSFTERSDRKETEKVQLLVPDRFYYQHSFYVEPRHTQLVSQIGYKNYVRGRYLAAVGREACHVYDKHLRNFVVADTSLGYYANVAK